MDSWIHNGAFYVPQPGFWQLGDGIVWRAELASLPLSTSSNGSALISALSAMGLTLTRASSATVQTGASTVVTSGIGSDVPRVGDGGYGRGLVIEESRTNRIERSAAHELSPWFKESAAVTVTADQTTAPDSSTDADLLSWTSGALRYIGQNVAFAVETSVMTSWLTATSGSFRLRLPSQAGVSNVDSANFTPSGSWARFAHAVACSNTGSSTAIIESDSTNASFAGHVWGSQVEAGTFPTELIATSGSPATRATERLYLASDATVLRSGRVGLELQFVPKGSRTEIASTATDIQLYAGANFSAFIAQATGYVSVYVNGSAYTTGTAINWSRGDVVQVWIESGGGSLNTVVKYRVNGGATTTLGTSGSPQASITGTTGNVDFLSYGAFAAYRLSSWVQAIRAYGYGKRPSWAR